MNDNGVKLTEEQALALVDVYLNAPITWKDSCSAVLNEAISMGVVAPPTKPDPDYPTREAALKSPPPPPPGYVEPTPGPKPALSLIEACAEAACSAHGCAATWEKTMFKEEWLASTRAAITRFLEEPVRHKETDRACDAYLQAKENEGGVTVNLGRMGAALNEYRRLLLERVKEGV